MARAAVSSLVVIAALGLIYGFAVLLNISSVTTVVTTLFINVTLVVGTQIFSGNSGLISWGHVSFMGLGAYIAAALTTPVPLKATLLPALPEPIAAIQMGLVLATLLTVLVVAIAAAIIGVPLMRMDANAVGIGTFGVLVVVFVILSTSETISRSGQPFYGALRLVNLPVAALGAAISVTIARFFRESPIGLQLQAAREDELAAQGHGVSIFWSRMASWVLSAAVVAFGGILWAHYITAFSPRSFYFTETFLLMAMLITGGMASVSGAVAGTVAVTTLSELVRRMQGARLLFFRMPTVTGLSQALLGILIIVVMNYRPAGLLGLRELDEYLPERWWIRLAGRSKKSTGQRADEPPVEGGSSERG